MQRQHRGTATTTRTWLIGPGGVQPHILCRADFHRLATVPKPPREQLACCLSMQQGFRAGEVTDAQLDDVDVDGGVLYCRDSKDHVLYPLPLAADTAYAYDAVAAPRVGHVLTHHPRYSKWRGHAVTLRHYRNLVQRWARDGGVRDWSRWNATMLRAYFAKEWARRGGDIVLLSKMLRHRSPFTTWLYLRQFVYVEDLRAEMERLQRPRSQEVEP